MIQTISAIDRKGIAQTFSVICEEDNTEDYPYYAYQIKHPTVKTVKNFIFDVIKISDDRMVIYSVYNWDLPEYSGKGIVKAMIAAVSKEFNCDVVSSSNCNSDISLDDGRRVHVTRYWKKWSKEMSNVSYIREEDRFIYKKT